MLQAAIACSEDPNDDSNPFREDVARCEDAVAHASSCCQGAVVAPPDACRFSHYLETCSGCSEAHGTPKSADTWPVLSIEESAVIENEGCAAIDCDEVQTLVSREHSSGGGGGGLDCY